MIISIVGKADTRAVAYPLIRAMSMLGKTAVITDDGAYSRLLEGRAYAGECSGVTIAVTLPIKQNIEQLEEALGQKVDNLFYISGSYVDENSTGVIICKGIDRGFQADEPWERKTVTEQSEVIRKLVQNGAQVKEITVAFDRTKNKGEEGILLKEGMLKYIYECEERQELIPLEDRIYADIIAGMAHGLVGMGKKELATLIAKKEYLTGK